MDTTDVPLYDPRKHTDEDTFVLVAMYSTTGSIFRQADPVGVTRPHAEEWVARQLAEGGEPASPATAIAARSGPPPKPDTEGAVDHTDGKTPKAWMFEPADLDLDEVDGPDVAVDGDATEED